MSAILEALNSLNQSLDNLEAAAELVEQKNIQISQQDLFNGDTNGAANGNGHHAIDPAILANKLDVTIERIEEILREG